MKNSMENEQLEKFMLESNAIEGEDGLNPNDLIAAKMVVGLDSLKDILVAHRLLTEHLNVDWGGKWREVEVKVGDYSAPPPEHIERLMYDYWIDFYHMDSYRAHNEFEIIHPFQDFNGRVGRLIWLSKAVKEGYNFSIPFLQKYYYQTLSQF